MAVEFSRSMRALAADAGRRSLVGLLLAAGLLGAWGAWFFLARVATYEVSETARLEADRAVHPVEAPVAGRIVATRLVLSQEVQAGDVLVELDTKAQRLQLEEERTRLAASASQLAVLRKEISAEEQARGQERQEMGAALQEARARHRETEAMARFAQEEVTRQQRLHARGLVSEMNFLRAQAEAQQRRAAADALRLASSRLELNQRTRDSDRVVHLERLKRAATQFEGELATIAATIERLEYEIERRRIRAPVAGQLGEVAVLQTGSVVQEKDTLGVVVSPGGFKIVADFPPPPAVGRVRPGQPARLRLIGFPWPQYGSIPAVVERVASEPRSGRIRVELTSYPAPASPIPFQHGLPGTVEVEVDRVSPATLALRAAGRLFARPSTPVGAQDMRVEMGR
jgi:multidrug resistance efflux pump